MQHGLSTGTAATYEYLRGVDLKMSMMFNYKVSGMPQLACCDLNCLDFFRKNCITTKALILHVKCIADGGTGYISTVQVPGQFVTCIAVPLRETPAMYINEQRRKLICLIFRNKQVQLQADGIIGKIGKGKRILGLNQCGKQRHCKQQGDCFHLHYSIFITGSLSMIPREIRN